MGGMPPGGMPMGGMPPGGMPMGGMPMGGMPMGGMPQGQGAAPQEEESRLHLALYEVLMLIFVIIFALNCLIGKNKNESLAHTWYQVNRDYLENNYAHIGVNSEYNSNQSGTPILKESYNNFKFYASGRKFVKWMLVNMDVSNIRHKQ